MPTCAGLPVNTDENAASVTEEIKHDAAVKAINDNVKSEEALAPPANGAHCETAIGDRQSAAAPAGGKRKAEDAADGHAGEDDGTAAAGDAAGKKPKPSPAKQSPLEKAAAARGQQTMSSFFSKKAP